MVNAVVVDPDDGVATSPTLSTPVIDGWIVHANGYCPAPSTGTVYVVPAGSGPESNNPSPLVSVAVCWLGPRDRNSTAGSCAGGGGGGGKAEARTAVVAPRTNLPAPPGWAGGR